MLLSYPELIEHKLPNIPLRDDAKPSFSFPYTATSVLLPLTPSKNYSSSILVCGGTLLNGNASPYCYIMEMGMVGTNGTWNRVEDMPIPRVMGILLMLCLD